MLRTADRLDRIAAAWQAQISASAESTAAAIADGTFFRMERVAQRGWDARANADLLRHEIETLRVQAGLPPGTY